METCSAETRDVKQHSEIRTEAFHVSPGEIHYLYWYIQGSIMDPEIRQGLRRAWGFCERHAWAAMLVEAAFRPTFLHGPAMLYEDIMSRAAPAFDLFGPLQTLRLRINLRDRAPCLMCEMGYGPGKEGKASQDVIERGANASHLRAFAGKTKEHWAKTVCGICSGSGSSQRCRRHLMEDATNGVVDLLSSHRDLVTYVHNHLLAYARSFVWGYHGTETDEDKAALITSIGWCSGWKPLLQIIADASP